MFCADKSSIREMFFMLHCNGRLFFFLLESLLKRLLSKHIRFYAETSKQKSRKAVL